MSLKKKYLFVLAGVIFLSLGKVIAISIPEIEKEILVNAPIRYAPSSSVKLFMIENGISNDEIELYIKLSKIYQYSKELKWNKVENGIYLFDEMIFSIKEIKKEYDRLLKETNNPEIAYEECKLALLNNSQYVYELIQKIVLDQQEMSSVFEKVYYRKPTDKEKLWLNDIDDLKYAIYGGELGREITDEEYELIKEGKGYELFGIDSNMITEYLKYKELEDKMFVIEKKYYNSVVVFSNIRTLVIDQYKVDINKVLTEEERLEIHKKSVSGFIFNESKAIKHVEKLLKAKGYIKAEDEVIEIPEESIIQDSSTSNPNNQLKDYLSNNKLVLNNVLNANLKDFYKINKIKYENNLKDTYVYVKHKNKIVNTYIRPMKNGTLSKRKLLQLIDIINQNYESKSILTKTKIMLHIDKEIKVSALDLNSAEMPLGDVIKSFKRLSIEVYEEDILKGEKDNNEKQDESVDRYILSIALKEENYELYSDSKGNIYRNELLVLFEKMDINYVEVMDKIMLLRDGRIFVVDIRFIEGEYVSIETLKNIMDKLEIDADINLINRDK